MFSCLFEPGEFYVVGNSFWKSCWNSISLQSIESAEYRFCAGFLKTNVIQSTANIEIVKEFNAACHMC